MKLRPVRAAIGFSLGDVIHRYKASTYRLFPRTSGPRPARGCPTSAALDRLNRARLTAWLVGFRPAEHVLTSSVPPGERPACPPSMTAFLPSPSAHAMERVGGSPPRHRESWGHQGCALTNCSSRGKKLLGRVRLLRQPINQPLCRSDNAGAPRPTVRPLASPKLGLDRRRPE